MTTRTVAQIEADIKANNVRTAALHVGRLGRPHTAEEAAELRALDAQYAALNMERVEAPLPSEEPAQRPLPPASGRVTKTSRYSHIWRGPVRIVEVGATTKTRADWGYEPGNVRVATIDGIKVTLITSVYQGIGSGFLIIPGLGDYRFIPSSSSETYTACAEAILERAMKGGLPMFPSLLTPA